MSKEEHVSVPREFLAMVETVLRNNDCNYTADGVKAILSRATPSEVPANHRDHLKPEHAERYYVTQAEIDATHPMNTHCDTCPADNVAMILVGERHEKRNLVDLVRTLLLKVEAKTSAPRVVTDDCALRFYRGIFGGDTQPNSRTLSAFKEQLESFATSLPAEKK